MSPIGHSAMTIEIDTGSGFCFGVTRAIGKAEEELQQGCPLYCLGDIVHNGREVERLRQLGLVTIDHHQFAQLRDANVLLRAHGEPPSTYLQASANHIKLIDATCPVVLHLQERIRREYEADVDHRRQIVIFGKPGHAEVLGLVGQTAGTAIVIEGVEDAAQLDFSRDICLYSQTTKPLDTFRRIVEYIQQHIAPTATFTYADTICRQVANRMPHIREFAARHDVVFFVCGRKSSNGRVLFDECKRVNPNSFLIDSPDELTADFLDSLASFSPSHTSSSDSCTTARSEDADSSPALSIGICGATSTPKWLMEQCRDRILNQNLAATAE